MEFKSAPSILSVYSLRHRKSLPDVPRDVTLEHLNDPNFDYETYETSTIDNDIGFELGEKRHHDGVLSIGRSVKTVATSEYDAESQAESRTDSRVHIRTPETIDYAE